jgi:putative nucleotidyltransferase-like protein
VAERIIRRAAVRVLERKPDFAFLEILRRCDPKQSRKLLRWLDQGGIALQLLSVLQVNKMIDQCPQDFREALELRSQKNRARMQYMLGEFERINKSLTKHGAVYCAVKGFTLFPEFCADLFLRHQTDFDFLIAPESEGKAAQALDECGYSLQESSATGETTFGTPLLHVPSRSDEIYELPRHRQVDMHISLWSEKHCVSLRAPAGALDRARSAVGLGVPFRTLATDDMFLLQVVHAFQHLLDCWVRLSWLYEIDFFLSHQEQSNDLWESVKGRVGDDHKTREAVGLILLLTSTLFGSKLPTELNSWCVEPLNENCKAWVHRFGIDWATADFPGNSLPLLVHRYFIDEPKSWNSYLLWRLLPLRSKVSSKPSEHANWRVRTKSHVFRVARILPKTCSHLRNVLGPFLIYGGAFRSSEPPRPLSVLHNSSAAQTSESQTR